MRKNRECERYCSEVEKSKECHFFWMCSGLWSFTQTCKCKILTIVKFVAPLGSWFFPYLGGFPRKILVSLFLFYSRWLTALLCFTLIAFITANIISVTDLFPTIGIRAQVLLIYRNFAAYCTILNKENVWSKVRGRKIQRVIAFS